MNRTSLVATIGIAVLILVWVPVRAQTPSATDEDTVFRLRIWSDQKSYATRENFPIHVELTNVSSHNILVGTDWWLPASPSRVTLAVTPTDGHRMGAIGFAVDYGYPPGARFQDDFAKELLRWCFLLPPQYSYGSVVGVGGYVNTADLIPGSYKVRATYKSFGIDANTDLDLLLGYPKETARLQSESWKGVIESNEIIIKIVASKTK